ncbi:hypothetical protein ACFE04_009457 [Oxalis oulophora]
MAYSYTSQASGNDAMSLEEAICNQQQQLQKLYNELDVEREASSSAASEALSMILRLQGEKAAMRMEASQYQRMAEERIGVVEECLEAYEDLILQKEMEIASLEHQLEAYRYKLMSVGSSEIDSNEDGYQENLLNQKNESFRETENDNILKQHSLPPMWIGEPEKRMPEPAIQKSCLVTTKMNENADREVHFRNLDLELKSENSACEDLKSRWELIRNMLEEVKESGKYGTLNIKPEPTLVKSVSTLSTASCYETPRCQLDQIDEFGNSNERETFFTSRASSNIHDVFEVPQTCEELKICEKLERKKLNFMLERQKRIRKLNMVPEESLHSDSENEEIECIKTMLLTTEEEKILPKSEDRTSFDLNTENDVKLSKYRDSIGLELGTEKEKRLPNPGEGTSVENKSRIYSPTNSVSKCEASIQQLSRRIMERGGEHNITRTEISEEHRVELDLLKELQEQLNSIRSEMRIRKSKKSYPADDWRFATLREFGETNVSMIISLDRQCYTFGFKQEQNWMHPIESSSTTVKDLLY